MFSALLAESEVLVSGPVMNVLRGWYGLGLTLVSFQVQGQALTLTSQRCAVNTWAEVSPVPVTTRYVDVDSAEDQTLTNQSQSCLSSTNFGFTSLTAQATVDFQRTNILTATEFRFAHHFQMLSQSQPPVAAELRLSGFAAAEVSVKPVRHAVPGHALQRGMAPRRQTVGLGQTEDHRTDH